MASILWEGPSQIDGRPIRLYGVTAESTNDKTGPTLRQTYIMLADRNPVDATKTGHDRSICGDCMHRPANVGSCYVLVFQGPRSIWQSTKHKAQSPKIYGRGHKVRLGAYGDPAAVPYEVWRDMLEDSEGWVGYTHQWKTCDQRLKRYCMASVDSVDEYNHAHDLGWRCYYVGASIEDQPKHTLLCPASAEAGKRTTCDECMACSGLGADNRRSDIFTVVHGAKHKVQKFKDAA